jgi:hypothetical protein
LVDKSGVVHPLAAWRLERMDFKIVGKAWQVILRVREQLKAGNESSMAAGSKPR